MPLPVPSVCPPPAPTPAPDPGAGADCCDLSVGGALVSPANPVPTTEIASVEIEPHAEALSGIDSFTTPALTQSVSVLVRAVGVAGSVTITTADAPFAAIAGETFTWSVARGQDIEVQPITVDTTDAGDEVLIIYTVEV